MLEFVNYRAKLGVVRCLRHLVFRLNTRSPRHMIREKEKKRGGAALYHLDTFFFFISHPFNMFVVTCPPSLSSSLMSPST